MGLEWTSLNQDKNHATYFSADVIPRFHPDSSKRFEPTREQRPSDKGDLDSSVTGEVAKVYYTGVGLLLILFLYRSTWLLLSCVLNGTPCRLLVKYLCPKYLIQTTVLPVQIIVNKLMKMPLLRQGIPSIVNLLSIINLQCDISGSYGGDYEGDSLLGYCAV
jgi:hypothetical protein